MIVCSGGGVDPKESPGCFVCVSVCVCVCIVSLTSMSSEEELFFDAPSSPVGDRPPFFSDDPPTAQSSAASLRKRTMATPEPQKNMTDLLVSFMINKVCHNSSKHVLSLTHTHTHTHTLNIVYLHAD